MRTFEKYAELSRQATERHAPLDLIVWPETMLGISYTLYEPGAPIPGRDLPPSQINSMMAENAERRQRLLNAAGNYVSKTPVLLGATVWEYDFGAPAITMRPCCWMAKASSNNATIKPTA